MSEEKTQPKAQSEGSDDSVKQDAQALNKRFEEMFGDEAEVINASDIVHGESNNAPNDSNGLNEESDKDSEKDSDETLAQEKDKAYQALFDRYQRSLAEFDNFRKRTLKEKSGAYDSGVHDTVEKLLPILDNFERALAASEDKEDTFYQGIVMISRQLEGYLADLGVEIIEGHGVAFDPNLHYAVAHVEDPEYGSNEVIDELQKGYIYKGKVIRPSMVRVAN